jgi:hypothetical protein
MAPPCLTLSATDTRRYFYNTILTQARANGGRTYGLRNELHLSPEATQQAMS